MNKNEILSKEEAEILRNKVLDLIDREKEFYTEFMELKKEYIKIAPTQYLIEEELEGSNIEFISDRIKNLREIIILQKNKLNTIEKFNKL